jgi:hypothetical protein
MIRFRKISSFVFVVLSFFLFSSLVYGASPTSNNWFQLLVSPSTGYDETGDGGTGSASDYNYFYVGQTFTTDIQIKSEHTNASNIWIDYDTTVFSSSNITTGTYFSSWSGQTITSGRIKSTGFNISAISSGLSGSAGFGSVDFTALKPTEANYGINSPDTITINTGIIGSTTESNISYLGTDILQEVENFNLHIWADTKAPYVTNPDPTNGASGVDVDTSFTFDLRDSKNGAGDNTGVGTGVNTSMTADSILISDQTATSSYTANTSFSCSGTWGTNLCATDISPLSPLSIPGDNRHWEYDTDYTVQISGFRDYASSNQNQLGDTNGPNDLATTTYSFTTESDTVRPAVQNKVPAASSTGISIDTNIDFDIVDKKSANVSGTGVDVSTCAITISSPSFTSTTYQQGSTGVTVSSINYGYHFEIDPVTPFEQNETVSVNIHDCQDLSGVPNVMVTDIYTFTTSDSDTPFVDTKAPDDDETISVDDSISFHIKDDGTGIDLANTVIYLNGYYYTLSGGSGSVTNTGTKINFASSLKFAGGNYSGDTTTYSCTSGDRDCTFTLKPSEDFVAGEGIPVIIYTRDNSGNLMERVAYTATVEGGACLASGSSFCGSNTTWDASLSKCTGTGGSSSSSGGSGSSGSIVLIVRPNSTSATQVNESTVLITWYSTLPSTSRVVYGTAPQTIVGPKPNYGYQFSTPEINSNSTYHAVEVTRLKAGEVYYFRPITRNDSTETYGSEVIMAPKFATKTPVRTITITTPGTPSEETCSTSTCPACPTNINQSQKPTILTEVFNRTTTTNQDPLPLWLKLITLLATIILIAGLVRLAISRLSLSKLPVIILALIFVSLITTVLFFANIRDTFFGSLLPLAKTASTVSLSGRIIDPVNRQGVANIDLTNGNTTLRTSGSGQYIFGQVSTISGIRLTAPTLIRALAIIPPAGSTGKKMDIYFDPELYNTLTRIIDLEARGQTSDTYEYLATEIKNKITPEDYAKIQKNSIFKTNNTTDQELKIRNVQLADRWISKDYDLSFTRVMQITLTANNKNNLYQLIKEAEGWRLIK